MHQLSRGSRLPTWLRLGAPLLFALVGLCLWTHTARAQEGILAQTDIPGPPGSGQFGAQVYTLPTGNFVVVDALYDSGVITNVGAVSLYDGVTLALISRLTGSTAGDEVGGGAGVVVLADGDFVVRSPLWDAPGAADAGAATWVNGTTGLTGTVSAANSLVGSTANDQVGSDVIPLLGGDYVVASPSWDAPGKSDAGAATFGKGDGSTVGPVSASNSLIGGTAADRVSAGGVAALADGDYVVASPFWDAAGATDAGAATWGKGDGSSTGVVTTTNSLVGGTTDDNVGNSGATALTDGDYVVPSPYWDAPGAANAGAATFGKGDGSTVGPVSAANSLVGGMAADYVGNGGVDALTDGDYVVASYAWNAPGAANAGAVTFGAGDGSTTGVVTTTNSLVGSTAGDGVGQGDGVVVLTSGHFVVSSPFWDAPGAANAGAVTFGKGDGSTTGVITSTNSLVGSTADDNVGIDGVRALPGGAYVVASSYWDAPGKPDAGAATFGKGDGSTVGPVSASNSLIGGTAADRVSAGGVAALADGDYVVSSYFFDAFGALDVGAATFGDGDGTTTGVVTATNSLVGLVDNYVGNGGVTPLANGNYVVASFFWDALGAINAGAATFGDGDGGSTGVVTSTNSLIGNLTEDRVSSGGVFALPNGNYVVGSYLWDAPAAANAGAITLGNGRTGTTGGITSTNSVIGATAGGGAYLTFDFDTLHQSLVVGRPADNIVTVAALRWTLSVSKAGTGGGTVASSPAGIACGATCTLPLNGNLVVTLTASPAAGSIFAGWSGACTNLAGPCVVTIDETKGVTATFTLQAFDVEVTPSGTGGTVEVEVVTQTVSAGAALVPVRVAAVDETYPFGTVLRLTAVPDPGYTFVAWGGDLTGSANPEEVTVDGALSISATFVPADVYLPLIDK